MNQSWCCKEKLVASHSSGEPKGLWDGTWCMSCDRVLFNVELPWPQLDEPFWVNDETVPIAFLRIDCLT